MKKIFWGLFFILGGIFIIINQLGYFDTNVNLFSIICTIFLIPIFVSSLFKLNYFGILFSAALLLIIYREPLNLENLTPITILTTALLGSIGLSIIFDKHHVIKVHHHEHFDQVINSPDSEEVNLSVSFGSSIKYVNTDNFKTANIRSSFGAAKVYFDNAKIKDDTATINLDVSFSGVELYIPKDWKIINKIDTSLGGVEEKNNIRTETEKTVVLTGKVSLGGIEIIYI